MKNLFDLTGQRALVTGSSQGIGFTLAQGLADAGASIVINGRDEKKLNQACVALREQGASVEILAFDVTDYHAVKRSVDQFEAENGGFDILVNNAGMQHRGPLEDFEPDAFEHLCGPNGCVVFKFGKAAGKTRFERGRGKLIIITLFQT